MLAKPRLGLYHIWNYSPRIYALGKEDQGRQGLEEHDFDRNYMRVMLGLECESDVCRCKMDLITNLLQGLARLKKKETLQYTTAVNVNVLINYAEKAESDWI